MLAIRVHFPKDDNREFRILVEVEILLPIVSAVLRQFYAYKSTAVAMVYIKDNDKREIEVLGSSATLALYKDIINLTLYIE